MKLKSCVKPTTITATVELTLRELQIIRATLGVLPPEQLKNSVTPVVIRPTGNYSDELDDLYLNVKDIIRQIGED